MFSVAQVSVSVAESCRWLVTDVPTEAPRPPSNPPSDLPLLQNSSDDENISRFQAVSPTFDGVDHLESGIYPLTGPVVMIPVTALSTVA